MNDFSIIRPVGTTNLITNPSVETTGTGWNAVGGSIARVTTYQRFGAYSLSVTPTSATTDGVYVGSYSITAALPYTFSVYVLGASGVPYRIYFATTGASVLGTPTTFTGTGDWQRVEVTYTPGTTTVRLYVVKNSSSSTAVFYVDGAQLEQQSAATTYCDGDQPGCYWSGTDYTSTSVRESNVRSGGTEVNLYTYKAAVVDVSGVGAAQTESVIVNNSVSDGGEFQRQITRPRVMTINLSVNGETDTDWDTNLRDLHALIAPDAVSPQQPFILRYAGASRTLEIPCVADGDFSLQGDKLRGISSIALRTISPDPYWSSLFTEAASLTVSTSTTVTRMMSRNIKTGVTSNFGGGANNTVNALLVATNGTIYAAGSFTNIGGSAISYIASWNGSSWSAMGTAPTAAVYALAETANGDIIAAGDFTTIGGTASPRIARWNGSTWAAVGSSSTNSSINCLLVGNDGSIYAGGAFTSIGGVAANAIGRWDGSAWNALGSGITGGSASILAMTKTADSIYVSGSFSTVGGTTSYGFGRYRNGTWEACGPTGVSVATNVYECLAHPDGSVYVLGPNVSGGGATPGSTGVSSLHIVKFTGGGYTSMNGGLETATPYGMAIRSDRALLVFGAISSFDDGLTSFTSGFNVVWNGSTWIKGDIFLPFTQTFTVQFVRDTVYVAGTGSGSATAYSAAITTVTNSGKAKAYPVIRLTGPTTGAAQIHQIVNETTGEALYFNKLYISAGETITMDLRQGVKTIRSNFNGSQIGTLMRGSKLQQFGLQTGANSISTLVINEAGATGTVTAVMYWVPRHWSIHGGV